MGDIVHPGRRHITGIAETPPPSPGLETGAVQPYTDSRRTEASLFGEERCLTVAVAVSSGASW